MGEPEVVMAEPEEGEAAPDGLHPGNLMQDTPYILSQVINTMLLIVTQFGWVLVGLAVLGVVVWRRLKQWQAAYQEGDRHKNPDKYMHQERAIDAARRKMQEEYAAAARLKQQEEEQEQEERLRNNTRTDAKPQPSTKSTSTSSVKPKFRTEYNPMMGDTGRGSCGWRPGARPGGAGGG